MIPTTTPSGAVQLPQAPKALQYPCACCDHLTRLTEPTDYGTIGQCPVCGWVTNFYQEHDDMLRGLANGVSLRTARDNYRRLGAVREGVADTVRPPRPDECSELWFR